MDKSLGRGFTGVILGLYGEEHENYFVTRIIGLGLRGLGIRVQG